MSSEKVKTILIVDDVPENVDILNEHLSDFKRYVAINGKMAIKVAKKTKPDLILLDVMMPIMDGFEAAKIIKADPELKNIPIIFLTAKAELEDKIKGFQLGAVDYITKPFEETEVIARVNAHVELKKSKDKIIEFSNKLKYLNDQLEEDLSEAEKYLRSLLPDKLNKKVITDWVFVPATHLGGDSFGYRWLDDNNLAVYVLDVSGHGVGAALLSVSALNLINSKLLSEVDFYKPNKVCELLNKNFQMIDHQDKYFTLCYGVINTKNNEFTYSLAGHPSPILVRENGTIYEIDLIESYPIGMFENTLYENIVLSLESGDNIYLISDGCFDVFNSRHKPLDYTGIKTLLLEESCNNVSLNAVYERIKIYCNGIFDDDYTMLSLKIE